MGISPGGSEGARIGSSQGPSNTAHGTVVDSYISIRLQGLACIKGRTIWILISLIYDKLNLRRTA